MVMLNVDCDESYEIVKGTKTFWIRMIHVESRGRGAERYENLFGSKDTKTFWMRTPERYENLFGSHLLCIFSTR
jgi:hypothetical protein